MATKTVNRQTFSVDYDLDDLNQGMFSMTEFKGICDRENDVTVDQSTFSKAENVYVNDNSVLASRAPFKFADGEAYIVNELYFGVYGLRIYKQVSDSTYTFTIACFTHETYTNDTDKFSTHQFVYSGTDDITLDIPKVTGIQIEDKVFIWFAGQEIIVFNTAGYYDEASGQNLPFFEDAYKYLYIPAHTLVTNGFESELEAQNFLTDSYIKRYLYTTESSVDWTELDNKFVKIYQSDNSARKELWEGIVTSDTETLLTYPFISVGNKEDYKIDTKVINGTPITVRTNLTTNVVDVSFGTSIFHKLPELEGTFAADKSPAFLTDDGFSVVRFTKTGFAICDVVALSSDETQLSYVDNFIWELTPYKQWNLMVGDVYLKHVPYGKFHSKSEYMYVFRYVSGSLDFVVLHGYVNFRGKNIWVNWDNQTHGSSNPLPPLDDNARYTMDFYVPQRAPEVEADSSINLDDVGPFLSIIYTATTNITLASYQFMRSDIQNPSEGRPTEEFTIKSSDIYNKLFTLSDNVVATNYQTSEYIKIQPTDFVYNTFNNYYWHYNVCVVASLVNNAETTNFISTGIVLITASIGYGATGTTQQLSLGETIGNVSGRWQTSILESDDLGLNNGFAMNSAGTSLLTGGTLISNLPDHYSEEAEDNGTYGWNINDHAVKLLNLAKPLYIESNVIYNWNGNEIWTNQLQSGIIIEIDTYENVTFDDEGNMTINFRPDVPDCFSALGDYYISFATIEDGQFRLLMSDTRRDEETNDFLLYLPDTSEQKFSQRITNLHPLADDTMGIFTEDEIWYIQALNLDNESVTRYTKAVKSKLPVGCRQGNEVITADNGQAILFAVPRGIVYLTPQDFVSTTDRQIKYISDAIQNIYNSYYFDSVKNSNAHEYKITIPSQIKIMTYSYWICFYRYMDNQILLIDTRSNSWWKWKTPYPILKLNNNGNLTVLMQIEKSKDAEDYSASLGGVSYLYCNLSYYLYQDDVLEDYIDGAYVIQTSVYGERIEYQYASPVIDWTFTTQKLHFGAINNYKYIRAININTNGEGKLVAKYTTKAYRDLYHPEASVTREIKINDLRTYVNRCNLLHVVNFALSLSSEDVLMVEPLSLNSISVKYEIKGQVR